MIKFIVCYLTVDQSSEEFFENSLQDGFLNLSTASIMFMGTDHAGCTSAKHLVFQESVPTTLQSTQLVKHEIYFRAEGDPTLRKVQPDYYNQIVYCSLSFGENGNEHCTTKTPATEGLNPPLAEASPESATGPTPDTSSDVQNSANHNVPSMDELATSLVAATDKVLSASESYQQSIDLKNLIEECANMDDFKKLLIKYSDGKVTFFHSFDCGTNFYQMREILKIFIKNVSLCTLVADCSKGLDINGIGLLQDYESFALRGLVIGSHCDLASSTMDPPSEFAQKVLRREFVVKNGDESIFDINCSNPQEADHAIAASIIDQQLCSLANSKRFPFSWYLFGFRLLRAMSSGVDTLSVSKDCMVIAENLKMDRPTVEAALEHLTEQNMIIYFRDILNDVVFSGVNFFSQFFSHLFNTISRRKYLSENELWKLAIVSESDLNDFVLNFTHVAQNMSLESYITLFMKLQILAPYNTGENKGYLLSCLLPILSESNVNRIHFQESSLSAPVFVKCPSTGQEFMCMLVVFLLTRTNDDWKVAAPVILFKNCIKFIVSSHYFVVISFSSGYLKVTVDHKKQETRFLWKISDIILKGLEMSKITLSCHKAFEFKLSFQCPCELTEHTATYNQERDCVLCDLNNNKVSPLHYERWLLTGKVLHRVICNLLASS